MRTLGATVVPVTTGSRTLRDATNEAMRDWMGSSKQTHYTIGSVVGPHPFPMIVRDFQAVIGRETRQQCLDRLGRLPDAVVACVGGGSNAAGMFYPFIDDDAVELIGAEAGGRGPTAGEHASSLTQGRPGVLHGSLSYVLQDDDGQTAGRPLDLRRARLSRRRPRAQLLEGRRPGPLRERHRRRGPRRLPHDRPARRDPARPRVEPRRGPGVQGGRPARRRARSSSSASPAAATRTPTRSPGSAASRSDRTPAEPVRPGSPTVDPPGRRPDPRPRPLRASHEPHRRPVRPPQARRPPRPDAVHHGGRPRPADHRGPDHRDGRAGGRTWSRSASPTPTRSPTAR